MSKCKKVKNPCKICLGPVTQKTGLQCQGACECWVHYACLNYTPGKIKDIKAGLITVMCPCPDCKSTLPKEFRTDEPFSCTNMKCPANQPPKCDNNACPINISDKEAPDKMNQTSVFKAPPLAKCGTECKKHSYPNVPDSPVSPGRGSPGRGSPGRGSPGIPCPGPPTRGQSPHSPTKLKCMSACSSSADVPGDYRQSPINGMPSLEALEQMCNTVGQLTNQINCLMNKMRQVVQERSGGGGGGGGGCGGGAGAGGCGGGNQPTCGQPGPRALCPKPCYCPGNPGRRK